MIADKLVGMLNRTASRNRRPFDPATTMRPPGGRGRPWAHYGVMVPGLPEPHRFFGVMSILGTPGVAVFANDHAITTSPADTVYTSAATAAMTGGQFLTHSIAEDCRLDPDGASLVLGEDLRLTGRYPHFTLTHHHDQVRTELDIYATDLVSHFAHIPGLYDHWSILAHCRGTITDHDTTHHVNTLGTVEYATGINPRTLIPSTGYNLPVRVFTYHVLNIDPDTQALLVQLLGPAGLPLQQRVYLRRLGHGASVHTRGYRVRVTEVHPEPARTPDGHLMSLPRRLTWQVRDDDGSRLLDITGRCHDDFSYGLGAGYVGSYDYTGTYRTRPITGAAYLEYVDRRPRRHSATSR